MRNSCARSIRFFRTDWDVAGQNAVSTSSGETDTTWDTVRVQKSALVVAALVLGGCPGGTSRGDLFGLDESSFVLTVADAPAVLTAGETSRVRVTVTRTKGRTEAIGSINFSVTSPPQGLSVTGTLSPAENEGSLALVTSLTTPPGQYELTLIGSSDGRIAAASFSLLVSGSGVTVVTGPPGVPVFSYPTNPAVYTRSVLISPNTPILSSGGPVSGWAITPALPLGLAFDTTNGSISGTPAVVSPATSYSVTAVGAAMNTIVLLTLSVNELPPMALSYTTPTATYPVGTQIAPNTPNTTGAPITSYSVSPSLPSGLLLDTTTGVISGTPTIDTAEQSYTITGSNSGGSTMATITITTVSALSNISYATNPATYLQNAAIAANAPTVSGGTPTLFMVAPSLPADLSLNASTGVITGTPSVQQGAANYVVTASNAINSVQVSLSIAVTLACAGQCVPSAPSGWSGPVAIRTGAAGSSPACTGSFPSQSPALMHSGLNAPPNDCSNFCNPGLGCEVQCYYWFYTQPSSSNGTCGGNSGGTGNNTNGCLRIEQPWQTYGNDVRIQGDAPYCRPTYGSLQSTPASWTSDAITCSGTPPSGACSAGNTCQSATAAPFEAQMCVWLPVVGDPDPVTCPGSYSSKRVFYTGMSDNRSCSQCNCSLNSAGCSYNIQACSGSCPSTCSGSNLVNTCVTGSSYNAPRDYSVSRTPSGSCNTTSSSSPTGSATGTGAIVVCCQP